MMEEKIQETLAGLKDFQRKTVDYVYKQLYSKGRSKMLIADEVGLGKTIVAKGLIAKAFEQFEPSSSKKSFNVVYICSNQALAKQNLTKLNFTKDTRAIDYSDNDDRITGLAYVTPKEEQSFPFRIKAFTPATSFDDKTSAGKADERVLLYRLLYKYSDLQPYTNSLKWILKGNRQMGDDNWESRIKYAEEYDAGKKIGWLNQIRPKVYSEFRKALESPVKPSELPRCFDAAGITYEVKYWTLVKNLCQLQLRRNNYSNYYFCKELISSLRLLLSKVCIEFLQADIFVLDEFQRYKKLIDNTSTEDDDVSPAIQLARAIFSFENTKILMLSATPFKPYTNDFDEMNGEVHYKEFITVLKFLMQDKADEFWKSFEHDRKVLFSFLRHPDSLEANIVEAKTLKSKMESLYRTSIVRTEKLLASKSKDALIKYVNKPVTIQADDINDFVALDQITMLLNSKPHNASLAVPLEYVKSCPFALSFLDHYQHKEKIRSLVIKDQALQKLLKLTKHGWVNLKDIHNYKPIIPKKGTNLPNAKLRLLLDETVHNNGWKFLWIPPSIPYYELQGAFKDSWGYSKTLLFSSWKMVPKMVASLVSYEAERLSVGNPLAVSEREKKDNPDYKPYYFPKNKKRSPRPQFTFKVEQEPQQMNNFILSYPSLFLANFYDPASNLVEKKSVQQIKIDLKKNFIQTFKDLNLNQYVSGEGDWQKWYWLAPLLMDNCGKNKRILDTWFTKESSLSDYAMDSDNIEPDKDENSGRYKHFKLAQLAFRDPKAITVGRLNNENLELVCEHLAELTLGSPAVCFLRSISRHQDISIDLLEAAYKVASAFFTMFNKPESIAIVRLFSEGGDYWERTLNYMIDGNLQAMLDEFIYLLVKGEGIHSVSELSDFISDILTVRTAASEVDDYPTFLDGLTNPKNKKKSMRAHYAVDFGTQKINTAKGAGRQINIRQAFNSPFRPFVLASTSIGQEGLDFHLYCKKIFHWNLPSNPIDFEQREGRIHRYQGLVIRLNLVDKYKDLIKFSKSNNDVWEAVFKAAEKEKDCAQFPCDLIPYWHTEPASDIKIERFVPLYPFSKDIEKYSNLIKILTFYRLTFGQPRQEELVNALHSAGFNNDAIKRLDDLIINLSPIRFS